MRASIAWSYALLPEAEQRLFRRLSVFVGGFSLEAAEAVTAENPGTDVWEGIRSLVEKSLLRQTGETMGEPRFGMLETIREFGLERLAVSGEASEIRARHLACYLDVAEQADRIPATPEKDLADRRLEAELPNLRAALDWAASQADVEPLLRLSIALAWFWDTRCSLTEAASWFERSITATTQVPPELHGQRARLLALAAMSALWQGQTTGPECLLDEALVLARNAGGEWAVARAMLGKAHLEMGAGDLDQAEAQIAEALERSCALNDPGLTLELLFKLAMIHGHRGEQELSEATFNECLAIARSGGWRIPIAFCLEALGTCAREAGDPHRAAGLFAEAMALVHDGRDPAILGNCLRSFASLAAANGRAEQVACSVLVTRSMTAMALASRGRSRFPFERVMRLRPGKGYPPSSSPLPGRPVEHCLWP